MKNSRLSLNRTQIIPIVVRIVIRAVAPNINSIIFSLILCIQQNIKSNIRVFLAKHECYEADQSKLYFN